MTVTLRFVFPGLRFSTINSRGWVIFGIVSAEQLKGKFGAIHRHHDSSLVLDTPPNRA